MEQAAYLKITGYVQGISLRYMIEQHANKNNLKGWVRNEPDGSVACCLTNPPEEIEKFISWLKSSAKGHLIKNISQTVVQAEAVYDSFTTIY